MWYEMLPTVGIIMTFLVIPQIAPSYFNLWAFGKEMRRSVNTNWDRQMILRDDRIAGNVWKTVGLEKIPDK